MVTSIVAPLAAAGEIEAVYRHPVVDHTWEESLTSGRIMAAA